MHIAFIETNPVGIKALETATRMGMQVSFLTSDIDYYLKGKPLNTHPLSVVDDIVSVDSTTDADVVCEALAKLQHVDAVLSFNDLHCVTAAKVAHRLGLCTMDPFAVETAKNKAACRDAFARHHVPCPPCEVVDDAQGAIRAAHRWGYPVVAKPVDGTGSLFVRAVHTDHELVNHVEQVQKVAEYGRSARRMSGILIEPYLDGTLFSAETYTLQGEHHILGFTQRDVAGYPWFVEVGSLFPAQMGKAQDRASRVVRAALDALNVNFGFCHTEFLWTQNGPVVIEVNPRMPGGLIPVLIHIATGIDIVEQYLQMSIGLPVELHPTDLGCAYSFHFTTSLTGYLVDVKGWDRILQDPNVTYAEWTKAGFINGMHSNFDRLGYVVVRGDSEQVAKTTAHQLSDGIRLVMRQEVGATVSYGV